MCIAVDFICDDPAIQAISFVGSDRVGKYIYERGSVNGKRVQSNMVGCVGNERGGERESYRKEGRGGEKEGRGEREESNLNCTDTLSNFETAPPHTPHTLTHNTPSHTTHPHTPHTLTPHTLTYHTPSHTTHPHTTHPHTTHPHTPHTLTHNRVLRTMES